MRRATNDMQNPSHPLFQERQAWLEQWAARPHRELFFVPSWVDPPPRAITPPDPVTLDKVAQMRGSIDDKLNVADPEDIGKWKTTHRQRRKIEHQLADRFEAMGFLPDKVEKMRCCRMHGSWGDRDHAGGVKPVVAWDAKCGEARLCPDEARAEQRRLVRRYKPACLASVKAKPTRRRIQKAVITWPNVPAGQLRKYKKLMFEEHAKLLKKFPVIRAQLVSQEDPLAADGSWNIHLNALYLVEGKFDWTEFVAAWHARTAHLFPESKATHFQIELRALERFDERALEKAIVECIKYPVKHVTEKANGKFKNDCGRRKGSGDRVSDGGQRSGSGCVVGCEDGRAKMASDPARGDDAESLRRISDGDVSGAAGSLGSDVTLSREVGLAPAMMDWPDDRIREWWEAGLRFRRTRSYGLWFKIGDPEREGQDEIRWRGRVWWDHRAGAYAVERAGVVSVDLIQGDKSGARKAWSDYFLRSGSSGADPPRYQ